MENELQLNSLEKISSFFAREDIKILHFLNKEKTRLYVNGIADYTIYLEELDSQVIFIRVWREWDEKNPITKQEVKDLTKCKAIKWKILKLLHGINKKVLHGAIYLEDMPEKMEDVKLNPKEKEGISILDFKDKDEY
ncbi:hypothetical protein ACI2U6_16395 [Ralstonia nicotianae]